MSELNSTIIEHQGVVKTIHNGRMTLRVNITGCNSCGHGNGCAINRLSRQDDSQRLIELEALPNLKIGDAVSLSLPESRLSLYALLGYFFPAFTFVLGAALGSALTGNDVGTAIAGLSSLTLGLLVTRFIFPLIPGMTAHISHPVHVEPISHFY